MYVRKLHKTAKLKLDAEVLEKATGLTLLGDCVTPYDTPKDCAVTGKPTTRRQHLARMY